MTYSVMSSNVAKRPRASPGPSSASMLRYLERLANTVCASQLEEPCSAVVLTSTYSSPGPKKVLPNNTMDRYLVRI